MADIKNVISKRLYSLFELNDAKQKDLASYLGVTDNTVSYFYNGRRMPNIEQIIKIAKYFNVSADYLLGLTDIQNSDLKAVCDHVNLSRESVELLHILPPRLSSTLDHVIRTKGFCECLLLAYYGALHYPISNRAKIKAKIQCGCKVTDEEYNAEREDAAYKEFEFSEYAGSDFISLLGQIRTNRAKEYLGLVD